MICASDVALSTGEPSSIAASGKQSAQREDIPAALFDTFSMSANVYHACSCKNAQSSETETIEKRHILSSLGHISDWKFFLDKASLGMCELTR